MKHYTTSFIIQCTYFVLLTFAFNFSMNTNLNITAPDDYSPTLSIPESLMNYLVQLDDLPGVDDVAQLNTSQLDTSVQPDTSASQVLPDAVSTLLTASNVNTSLAVPETPNFIGLSDTFPPRLDQHRQNIISTYLFLMYSRSPTFHKYILTNNICSFILSVLSIKDTPTNICKLREKVGKLYKNRKWGSTIDHRVRYNSLFGPGRKCRYLELEVPYPPRPQ